MPLISISTGAPAAFAFSEGAKVLTKGNTNAVPPIPPMTEVAIIQVRLSLFSSVGTGCKLEFSSALIRFSLN